MAFMSFYEYMLEAVESNEKIVAKLEKTRGSIMSHWKRGGEARHVRGKELAERYDDLAGKLKNSKEGVDLWKEYCGKHNFSTDHKGHDHYS